MTKKYDLHSHSTFSDGLLSPTDLLRRAQGQGVTALALTDHDTTAGIEEAKVASAETGVELIAGIELSASWQNKAFHILGLGIDPQYGPMLEAIQDLHVIRTDRAKKIADKLKKKHIPGAMDAVMKSAGDGMVTRSHFADFLVSQNYVSSQQDAFDRYLAKGKPAYVATVWLELELAVKLIVEAGGIPVLAHPLRYKLTANWMKRLLAAFKEAGGQGMEIVTGRCNADEIKLAASYANIFELAGSVGSDFHSPANPWVELGRLQPLPANIKPVWELFG